MTNIPSVPSYSTTERIYLQEATRGRLSNVLSTAIREHLRQYISKEMLSPATPVELKATRIQ